MESSDGEQERQSSQPLSTVEKVLLLQEVELFRSANTEDLAFIAQVSEEISLPGGSVLYSEGDAADSMYIVVEGILSLHRGGREILRAESGTALGAWSLFDEEPQVVSARIVEPSRLLRIERNNLLEILSDNVRLTEEVLRVLSARLRTLMDRTTFRDPPTSADS